MIRATGVQRSKYWYTNATDQTWFARIHPSTPLEISIHSYAKNVLVDFSFAVTWIIMVWNISKWWKYAQLWKACIQNEECFVFLLLSDMFWINHFVMGLSWRTSFLLCKRVSIQMTCVQISSMSFLILFNIEILKQTLSNSND